VPFSVVKRVKQGATVDHVAMLNTLEIEVSIFCNVSIAFCKKHAKFRPASAEYSAETSGD
tara:strand:- start:236 stop:415 length:180 start_codon:yes stop_codon:yes gene_type:complete